MEKIETRGRRVQGVVVNGRTIRAGAVVSNANLKGTIFQLVGEEAWDRDFVEQARAVRLNNSSTQVYMALRPDEMIDEGVCGDLLFSSTAGEFRTDLLLGRDVSSRTFSFYYPKTRPGRNRCFIVASTNARYGDWAELSKEAYQDAKRRLVEDTLETMAKYVPDIREKLAWVECATPLTFERYTRHLEGASFGTKFEGLAVSRAIPRQIAGLYHAGSVGIIMSGWLGAVNYGVIVANEADSFLAKAEGAAASAIPASIGQQQPVRHDLFFQRLAVHLKASQHRSPAIDEGLSLEQPLGDRKLAQHIARLLASVDAQSDKDASLLAAGNGREEAIQSEALGPVENLLSKAVGRIAVDHAARLSPIHRVFKIHRGKLGARNSLIPAVHPFGETRGRNRLVDAARRGHVTVGLPEANHPAVAGAT